jgi:hypothetical protein
VIQSNVIAVVFQRTDHGALTVIALQILRHLAVVTGLAVERPVVSDILAVIVATTIVVPSAFITTQLAGLGPRLFEDFKRVRVISKLPENISGTSFA